MKVFKFKEDAQLPTVKHKGDAGMDFYAYGNWTLLPHELVVVRTGVGVIVPEGYVGLLKPKGGSNHLVGAGVVDSNYRGEVLVKIYNPYEPLVTIEHGQAVGQMIFLKCLEPEVDWIDLSEVDETNRGATGGIVDERINKWD
jgi:dUTP pyrophosphatase